MNLGWLRSFFYKPFGRLFFILLGMGLTKLAFSEPAITGYRTDQLTAQIKSITYDAPNLNPHVLLLALKAYRCARAQGMDPQRILSIIDYSKPSTERRFWVINLRDNHVLFNTIVAQGKNSGQLYSTHFSNRIGSDESSLGLYRTGPSFVGNDGLSMRLIGLEPGFNSNAYRRDVVVHGAWYVSHAFIRERGRLGLSWGCPALRKVIVGAVIHTIENGTLIFAYYPNQKWLRESKFLHCPN